jgi:hypothetical protein
VHNCQHNKGQISALVSFSKTTQRRALGVQTADFPLFHVYLWAAIAQSVQRLCEPR